MHGWFRHKLGPDSLHNKALSGYNKHVKNSESFSSVCGCGSLVGSVSASQRTHDRSSHLVENSFPLPLIQKEHVVRYWRKNGHLMLVNCLQATNHPNMISVCYRNTKHNTNTYILHIPNNRLSSKYQPHWRKSSFRFCEQQMC